MVTALLGAIALSSGAAGQSASPAPRVATDIAPVHSLVARVMQGVGTPDLVVPPGASPHDYALRPSQARMLDDAALIVWMGPELAPWFGEAIKSIAPNAAVVTLPGLPGTTRLAPRSGGNFERHDHDHGHGHEGEHGRDADHADENGHAHDSDHDHADEHDHASHTEADHADEHDHDAGHADAVKHADPHFWLDPLNARMWLAAIAATLAELDPANAEAYRANAATGQAEIDALVERVSQRLEPLRGRPYIVFHDAYQYFERRFDFPAAGAIALSDAVRPSAARVAEIRAVLDDLGAACVFSEPQFEPKVVATVVEGTGAGRGTLDPVGADLEPGPGLYPALIESMTASFEACLEPRG
ncbi:zinc ABC transporter substrate-binding protein [Limibaculum sp. M0105]|uniref:High-affinity zinc uptake system protein ZnuA n=2 Tax=Thermohalobaculum xanthum TaxID=2753746 RepID=A0A8J7M669_9RHOB|nr:zinc ABC transporter substrate-binding protein [Thermohalobaculum xanthum]